MIGENVGDRSAKCDIDAIEVLRRLAALPHRATGSRGEFQTLEMLSGFLQSLGAKVSREPFLTHKTYHVTLLWLIGLIVVGLWLAPVFPALGAAAAIGGFALSALYFDWRQSPVTTFPPRVQSANLIARKSGTEKCAHKLVLMAHYDSAPISTFYRPPLIAAFHRSLLISLGVMAFTALLSATTALGMHPPFYAALRLALTLYLLLELGLGSWDFLRLGYSNAANDNASGVAAAVNAAGRLWRTTPPGVDVELVLTGAEEAGMIGALAYFKRHKPDPAKTWLINIDTVGCENLAVVERTGTLTDTVYHNALFDAAMRLARGDARFAAVRPATHWLADFDSVWFARAGVPCITLASYRPNGLMSGIHRPEDTLERVSFATVRQAADFAEALVRTLTERPAIPSA